MMKAKSVKRFVYHSVSVGGAKGTKMDHLHATLDTNPFGITQIRRKEILNIILLCGA